MPDLRKQPADAAGTPAGCPRHPLRTDLSPCAGCERFFCADCRVPAPDLCPLCRERSLSVMLSGAPAPMAADPHRRALAGLVDLGCAVALAARAGWDPLVTYAAGAASLAVVEIILLVIERPSPGRHLAGLRVESADGRPPTLRQALIRSVVRLLGGHLLGIGVLSAANGSGASVHDNVAGTRLVSSLVDP